MSIIQHYLGKPVVIPPPLALPVVADYLRYYFYRENATSFRPYTSLAEANASVPRAARLGRTVQVNGKEWWWIFSDADAGLIEKIAASSGGGGGTSYDDTAIRGRVSGVETSVNTLTNDLNAAEAELIALDGRVDVLEARQDKRCILVSTTGTRRYYDDFHLATLAMLTGDTLLVYGVQDYTARQFIANYANCTIYLAPGAELKAKEFFVHTPQLTICGPGAMTLSKGLSIEPICQAFLLQDVTLNGRIIPYAFGSTNPNGTTLNATFRRCAINAGATVPFDAQYGKGTAYFTYVAAMFENCRITTTAVSVLKFSDDNGAIANPGANAGNRLRLVGNTITAPVGALVADDSTGAFTFEQGANTYVMVSPPAKASSAEVVTAPGGSTAGRNIYAVPEAAADAVRHTGNTWVSGDLTAYNDSTRQSAGAPPAVSGQPANTLVGAAAVGLGQEFDAFTWDGTTATTNAYEFTYKRRNDGTPGWTRKMK